MRSLIVLSVTALAVTGCKAPPMQLSPQTEAILLTANTDNVRNCKSLGIIESGTAGMGRLMKGEKDPKGDALRRLKVKADSAGANVVLLINTSPESVTGGGGTAPTAQGGSVIVPVTTVIMERASGEAYFCPDSTSR
jgi:uncharacterized protein YbjQ (UPF0145 family)